MILAVGMVIYASAFLSMVIANIPFTAAMLPVIAYLTRTIPGADNNVLFYALSIGAAMGGNGSLIGASANLVTTGIAERAGYPITYKMFMRYGLPSMVFTVTVGLLWLFFQFLVYDLVVSGLVWVVYIALEPYARRVWPTAQIGRAHV